jgi:prolyl-tRNA synthetase
MSSRMVGAVIMAHGDDSGLQLPPRIAPVQVVIVPIFRSESERSALEAAVGRVLDDLSELRVKIDWRDERPGFKFNEWELKGVPIRLEIGPRDLAANQVTLVRRLDRAKQPCKLDELATTVPAMLEEIQAAMLQRAQQFRDQHTVRRESLEELVQFFEESVGFVITPWCERAEDEAVVKERTTATSRVILGERSSGAAACAICGRPASVEVAWGKAY